MFLFKKKKMTPSGPQEAQAASNAKVLADCIRSLQIMPYSRDRESAFYEIYSAFLGLYAECDEFTKRVKRLPSDAYLSKVHADQCAEIIRFYLTVEEGVQAHEELLADDIRRFVSASGEKEESKVGMLVLRFMADEVRELCSRILTATNEELIGVITPMAGALSREVTDFLGTLSQSPHGKNVEAECPEEIADIRGFVRVLNDHVSERSAIIRKAISEDWNRIAG
ncbi:hypothetical protein [Pseudodesulfovibrio senegalensis]|uniref:Uncharacterized protein n=1 Tax=Pseudodesulfovibrio senegalensis TaxID=1721087 RepID=A0A6N6N2V9_9BACT|nr:hypothetical protein [Pseudodesulfovibrio senegalensis]KAB1441372.1 hypothetical protein F8A88_10520 [Pseudodesulfovibrio senegalensis]